MTDAVRARVHVPPRSLRTGAQSVAEAHQYLTRALRCRPGDVIELFDGEGAIATARVIDITADDVRVEIDDVRYVPAPSGPAVISLLPLIKGERMDWCIQKLVELGVRP